MDGKLVRNVWLRAEDRKEKYVVFSKAAELLGITPHCLRRLERHGRITTLIMKGTEYRYFAIKEIDFLLKKQKEKGMQGFLEWLFPPKFLKANGLKLPFPTRK